MVDAPPVMLQISMCESGQHQFNTDGSVVQSKTHDYGLFQINRSWIPTAKKLGMDIMTAKGNVEFALWLYHEHHGFSDWDASRTCWGGNSG